MTELKPVEVVTSGYIKHFYGVDEKFVHLEDYQRLRDEKPKLPEGYRERVAEGGCRQLEKETIDGWVCVVAEINPTLFRNFYSTLLLTDLQAIAAFLQGAR